MATFVLIPGAGGDAWYWHLVVPELEAQGHHVVAVASPANASGSRPTRLMAGTWSP